MHKEHKYLLQNHYVLLCVGTELNIVQEGVPAVIPAETCFLGWQESLTLLAKLVEAEIPDET
jgi:hypothetical protein